jgi:3-carboxy-cis,cis-muconate cycloisomerase
MAEAVSMALAAHVGRQTAHELVEEAARRAQHEGKHLRDVLAADARVTRHLSMAELERALDPALYTGRAEEFVANALAAHRGRSAKGRG